jgi:hypothetical protein
LQFDEYDKYLETDHWKAFRRLAFADQRRRLGRNCCELCPQDADPKDVWSLHVHH